jgi:5-methylcytosine-specific restriction protein A
MPVSCPIACDTPGCLGYAIHGSWHCALHQPVRDNREADKKRYQANPWRGLYSTKGWTVLKEWKKSNNPICEECGRAGVEVIDHKIDHKGRPELFFERSNLRSLCKTCHDRKTGSTQGGKKIHAPHCQMRRPPGWVCTCPVNDASVPVVDP